MQQELQDIMVFLRDIGSKLMENGIIVMNME